MNKFLLIAKSVLVAIGTVGTACAGNDFSHYSLFNSWTGFYAGVDGGFAFNKAQVKSQQLGFTDPCNTCNNNSDFSTFSSGIQTGYVYQFSNDFVSGVEANVGFNTHQNDTLSCHSDINPNVYDGFFLRDKMQSSVKARAGRAISLNKNKFLPYVTAGINFANLELTYKNEGSDYYSKNSTEAGWLLGAGIEWAIKQNWSLRLEYSYVDYGNSINLNIPSVYGLEDPNGHAHVNLSANNVVLSLNYWI